MRRPLANLPGLTSYIVGYHCAAPKFKKKSESSNDIPLGGIFITCLKVVSLLKRMFFLHTQSLPQQQTR